MMQRGEEVDPIFLRSYFRLKKKKTKRNDLQFEKQRKKSATLFAALRRQRQTQNREQRE